MCLQAFEKGWLGQARLLAEQARATEDLERQLRAETLRIERGQVPGEPRWNFSASRVLLL